MSLEKALDYAGIEFEGHMHDALCDAKNTAELFAIVYNEERCNVVLKAVMMFWNQRISAVHLAICLILVH